MIIITAFSFFACNNNKSNKDEIREALRNQKDDDLLPYYKTVYTPDSVELENVKKLLDQDSIDEVASLTIFSNSCKEMKADFANYLLDSYQTLKPGEDRLPYLDIANIARFVVWKFKFKDTGCLNKIFEYAEILLQKGNASTKNLVVVGLFEGIQNVSGWQKVDYYKGFDAWLRPESKKTWDGLIEFWERERK